MHRVNVSVVAGIFHHLCPRCRMGKIFPRSVFFFPTMHDYCPVCDLKFEREEGYFLGAMYISYGLALATICLLAGLLWLLLKWPLQKSVIGAVLVFLPLAPSLALMARVLWIYLDQSIDPDKTSED